MKPPNVTKPMPLDKWLDAWGHVRVYAIGSARDA